MLTNTRQITMSTTIKLKKKNYIVKHWINNIFLHFMLILSVLLPFEDDTVWSVERAREYKTLWIVLLSFPYLDAGA